MLEKPDIPDSRIQTCLRDAYGINAGAIMFLPLGADVHTAVYRAQTPDSAYFVKLRRGGFDKTALTIPDRLHAQGCRAVIAPLRTRTQQLWAALDDFTVIVFPFVDGRDGYAARLHDAHWIEFGRAVRALHALPAVFPHEQYADTWRVQVRDFLVLAESARFADAVAAELAAFLRQQQTVIRQLIDRAETLAAALRDQPRPFVLCHADLHAGNVLIDTAGHLYIVDWDTLILAPKERDLMFVGGGLFANHRPAAEEERLFYQGYGPAQPDPDALTYYRCERIVQDVAAYCEQLLLSEAGGADRANSLRQLMNQFGPGGVVALSGVHS